ncbi:efflux RND transporter permease subunit [Thiohalobacter sp. IOR34]|uniref:efflux RND transporter permease subunit n=1 Tax=Thiohalobacter sp. IOR34 TaxID=3057176 RepID=UPI0025B2367B|nr:efflux RND transporter permease subunit [Thiohalobacter sp. IOR34]WJW75910.1 efflux RND transporter permease subunit [Thiohalobacter sp. IOR34]
MFLIRYSIGHPLITNLLLVLVLVVGVLSWNAMPQEMFPLVEKDMVSITTLFSGASPEEVEQQVTLPIEEAFDNMPDIDVMTSLSSEGKSVVTLKLKPGSNVDEFMRDAQSALDQISDLPEEAEKPELLRLETRFPVISMSLYGEVARGYLYQVADHIKQRMLAVPGVASVGVAGDREWELWVQVDPQRLAASRVSLGQVRRALRDNLRDLPGGSLKAREGDILLRGMGVPPEPEAIGRIPVRSNPQGGVLTLGELAEIGLRLEEARTLGRFNGKPSVNLTVTKTADASTIRVSERIRALAAGLRGELPPSLQVGLFSDLSVYVKTRLETVKSSGAMGLALLLLSLYLFLNFRIALITAMGIPVSFLIAVIGIHYLGYTINMVSLFAFLIALGLIVDDAIIVNENIYRHLENGATARLAAEQGAREVFWPVVASTATTIAAFLPMFAIGGTMGAFIAVIPVVVTAALLGSLWEAFGVLPSHANDLLRLKPAADRRRGRIDWQAWLQRYLRLLGWAVHNRYFVVLLSVSLLLLTLAFAVTRVPFNLFGHVDIGQFFINAEAPNTYSLEESARLAAQMEQIVLDTLDEDELDTLLTNVGVALIDFNRSRLGSRYIQLIIDLKRPRPQGFIERYITPLINLRLGSEGTRERSTEAIINALRERLQRLPGLQRMSILRPQGGPAGSDIEVGVLGEDIDQLRVRAQEIRDYLRRLPGVHDVRQDLDVGKLEYQYRLNDRGRQLGLTQSQLAEVVRTGYLGSEVVQVTYGDSRIPVRLIYPDGVRHDAALARLPLVLDDGRLLYLGTVADIRVGRALNSINRRDGQRLATVSAEVDTEVTTAIEVSEQLRQAFPGLMRPDAGVRLLFLGEKKEAADSMADAKRALLISLVIIFLILAALFNSLLDPLVVMFAIPFGAIGVVVGHLLFGFNLQFLSVIGFLALTGIVVNDSLILVDFVKRRRQAGQARIEAVLEAGRVRIRPILLTTVTTFLGISPLIFFATGQTAFLSPMAVSLGFGLLFATALVLVGIPCFYLVADDLRQWLRSRFVRSASGNAPR